MSTTTTFRARLAAWSAFLAEEGLELYRPRIRAASSSGDTPPAPRTEAGAPAAPPSTGAEEALAALAERIAGCQRCRLAAGRRHIVFGEGNPEARLMFVGEGPGADEDRSGRPFVGRAGELLTRMIRAMGLERHEVYIANIVKCRPPRNRDPLPDEVAACLPFLVEQIEAIRPEVIVTLGKPAAQALLGLDGPIRAYRGAWQAYGEIPVMPTYHPAYLLRNPGGKREAWRDLQAVMRRLGLERPR